MQLSPLACFLCVIAAVSACAAKPAATGEPAISDSPPVRAAEDQLPSTKESGHASLSSEQCHQRGGAVVGDIGDGAIHRPDYRCENGEPPLGTIQAADGEPVAVEGAVCCEG